jgi:hypothetical protein
MKYRFIYFSDITTSIYKITIYISIMYTNYNFSDSSEHYGHHHYNT